MFPARTLKTVSQCSRNEKTDVSWACIWTLIMSVPNERPVVDCSRRPDQPHKMPGCQVVVLFYDQITTSSGTESRKVGNSGNWNAHLVSAGQCPVLAEWLVRLCTECTLEMRTVRTSDVLQPQRLWNHRIWTADDSKPSLTPVSIITWLQLSI